MRNPQRWDTWQDLRWAIWPDRANHLEPLIEHCQKAPRPRILDAAELSNEPIVAEDRNFFGTLGGEAAVGKPDEQIKHARRGGEHFHSLQVGRNRMSGHLGEEFVAQRDHIFASFTAVALIPDGRLPEEVEPRPMNHSGRRGNGIGAEEDRRAEDSLEGGDQSAVLFPPFAIPKVSSITEADLNRIVCDCCRTARVAKKIGTSRS